MITLLGFMFHTLAFKWIAVCPHKFVRFVNMEKAVKLRYTDFTMDPIHKASIMYPCNVREERYAMYRKTVCSKNAVKTKSAA